MNVSSDFVLRYSIFLSTSPQTQLEESRQEQGALLRESCRLKEEVQELRSRAADLEAALSSLRDEHTKLAAQYKARQKARFCSRTCQLFQIPPLPKLQERCCVPLILLSKNSGGHKTLCNIWLQAWSKIWVSLLYRGMPLCLNACIRSVHMHAVLIKMSAKHVPIYQVQGNISRKGLCLHLILLRLVEHCEK